VLRCFGDLPDGLDAFVRLKLHAGLEFGVVSSAFAFHLCVFGFNVANEHHNHRSYDRPDFQGAAHCQDLQCKDEIKRLTLMCYNEQLRHEFCARNADAVETGID
jgi:hypothetical protein